MAVIYPHFLASILKVHDALEQQMRYPFFDPACASYETLRAVISKGIPLANAIEQFGLTAYGYRHALQRFYQQGVAGLIGLSSKQLVEQLPVEVERKVFVLKSARPWIPATKMVLILAGFGIEVPLPLMRHLYASYGWALGTKPYATVDFTALNRKATQLDQLQSTSLSRNDFFDPQDRLQVLLEVFRTLEQRGVTKRFPGSRMSFEQYKKDFLSLGLLGLVERARPPFRNSKIGFKEEGWIILSKIQKPDHNEAYYQQRLASKRITANRTSITKIFSRWQVSEFQSQFKGDLGRLLLPEQPETKADVSVLSSVAPLRLDRGFISWFDELAQRPMPLANPGVFLLLPYLKRLQLLEKAAELFDVDPERGYSWFSLLLLDIARIAGGVSSISKASKTSEPSFPLSAGLVTMPCADTQLNGMATIPEDALLQLRRYLTRMALQLGLIEAKRIAFDFHMRDFTHDDVELKKIGKAPSPKRQICFPGFRPHLAWDVQTGAPITLEFRNGRARATTTLKRFFKELLQDSLGERAIEHVYLDSEYTAEHIWQFLVDPQEGLGADLTMCVKQNRRIKKHIESFLNTKPTWLFFDEQHTYSQQGFEVPISGTPKTLRCVLKRHEPTGRLRCFGSTLSHLDSKAILDEYTHRWTIENGIKDLVGNYFFDNIPGIEPHRINLHYFVVTVVRLLFEMLTRDYELAYNPDGTQKNIGTLRPQFLSGVNVVLSRDANHLRLTWQDLYPPKQHQALRRLFDKLNQEAQKGIPFLGGIRLTFDITDPKPDDFRNQCLRQQLEF